jgi:hypothetical protein
MSSEHEQSQSPQDEGAQESAAKKSSQELIDELTRLGHKFAEVVEVAWNSEQRKKIEEDLRTGLVRLADSLETGIKRASETKEAQELRNAAEDVAGKVRSSKVAADLSEALSQGLRTLSEKLDEVSEEMRKKGNAAADAVDSAADAAQDIPIEKDK